MKKLWGPLGLSTFTCALFLLFFNGLALAINATFTISVLPPSEVIEGQKNLIFVLRRTGDLSAVTVFYKMSGTATIGQDYSAPPGSTQFSQGQETFNVSVPTLNDSTPENDETVTMTINTPPITGSYQIGSPSAATATIKDDEPLVTLSVLPGTPFEAAGSISVDPIGFQISRTGATANRLTVDLQLGGTAVNGTDYQVTIPVQIPAGSTQQNIPLNVKDDLVIDPGETVTLTILPNDQRYRVGSASTGTVTILDNDPPQVSLSLTDANAEEANLSTATVRVVRTGDVQQDITVRYTVNPTNAVIAGTPATSGSDFVALSGSVVLQRFRQSADIVITPLDDSLVEGTEKVLIHLAPATAYKLGQNQNQTISILDNDFANVTVTSTDGIASESGPDSGTFRFSRTGPTSSALTVRFSIATSGTNQATQDVDYKLPVRVVSNSVSIPSGQSFVDVAVTPIDDSQQEPQEQVIISVVQDAAYAIGSNGSATIFIGDND